MSDLSQLRQNIVNATYADEHATLASLRDIADLSEEARKLISTEATQTVRRLRASSKPGLMEVFLAEYGLSTEEGIALMCLAEALLRVPDAPTVDALIEDKIAPSDWGKHLGKAASSLVNASTWALMLTGRVLEPTDKSIAGVLRGAVQRLGDPVIRVAVKRAVKEMARQFVLGETIEGAMERGQAMVDTGYRYSFDMLGEAALTEADAKVHFNHYANAITEIGVQDDPISGAGISVKLSAIFPRYEPAQEALVMSKLLPRVRTLANMAKTNNMGFTIDAEEANRLDLSLKIIEALLRDPDLAEWDGLGVVVQAYGQRARHVIDWLAALCEEQDRKITLRLVKGAYWDSEIKHAQELGLSAFPVFTSKSATDISYIACAKRLLSYNDRIFAQFATHNAHTITAIRHIAPPNTNFEFQRLHGMGEALHDLTRDDFGTDCRIYAPVGTHRDLLAYLVRRLLENGANSSFVNQVVDEDVPPETVVADPFEAEAAPALTKGTELFEPERKNSAGIDLDFALASKELLRHRDEFMQKTYTFGAGSNGETAHSLNPFDPNDCVGHVHESSPSDIENALKQAELWDAPASERKQTLDRAAALFEENTAEIFALLCREAAKTVPDSLAELREAVDFLRYYGAQALSHTNPPVGTFTCISPWNFPLAIFTGQIAAALATGNAVLAKPAEDTPLIAAYAVDLLHKAGVPENVLQLIPGQGASVGAALVSDPRVDGVCFTGSTATALRIRSAMAENLAPGAPLIAETGGLNAMIIDSTALLEQAVTDVIASAFQSAGQRCSALRCVYVQEEVAERFTKMLTGAMDLLSLGNPSLLQTDIGPVINLAAQQKIQSYVAAARSEGRIIKELPAPSVGHFVAPVLISTPLGVKQMEEEIFGPVLHLATFKSGAIDEVLDAVNASGYGLTFGLHSRIDSRVAEVQEKLHVGNIYVNRNQIGAIVGSQPFGGEGLSGTGPKAGGPNYLARFTSHSAPIIEDAEEFEPIETVQAKINVANVSTSIDLQILPGPTGEANTLTASPRAPVLCLGPGIEAQKAQAEAVEALGGIAVAATVQPADLAELTGFSGAIYWGQNARPYVKALASRSGPILPLITGHPDAGHVLHERHLCVDTTAAGGNAALLAGQTP
ncbi:MULTISPECIES: bifunctional proline dehydrogenase/L-glutamate gamma-semialdehyde dehydrogenase PutA [Halocynthiibacter]|uniref:Bifunctional protein PutA n=1 Tax=Halocynthiibacter halioticoli TaxID=2986804 RepID=A0AAE3IZK1_9RHOB|nr:MULTISPECIES: bifunctional proline dehydrogenase/L-glutamate gamma-semialdehyde dehydrogenase PutA [Halocynthiibacter]MCV6824988.1 bifunctional proline dehydrogenase/L-glutamate gamma-semialdehyde dehydrogenase PutA [Halocynthiibacter halioticoli]MCW4057989.1 bifunctional proline dehydrogenase/L-glutamate gamma-semialdehyde dehydrogenase PutA [Halocynthiibacter sp. SDUM655004]